MQHATDPKTSISERWLLDMALPAPVPTCRAELPQRQLRSDLPASRESEKSLPSILRDAGGWGGSKSSLER
eukprot:6212597-Pleurochrysis_carterae.AAC.2